METPLGLKYIPYTYMDPLGYPETDAEAREGYQWDVNESEELERFLEPNFWVAVKELELSWRNHENCYTYIYIYTPIMVTEIKFLSSNPSLLV